jgi:hypothetical protein
MDVPLNEKYFHYNRHNVELEASKKSLLWDKNVIFFPRKIKGKFYLLHRIKPEFRFLLVLKI